MRLRFAGKPGCTSIDTPKRFQQVLFACSARLHLCTSRALLSDSLLRCAGETLQLAAVLTLEWSVVVTVNAEDVAIVRAVLSPKSQLQQDDDVFHDSVEKTSALGQALPRNKSWQPLVLTAADCMTVVGDLSALKSKASRKKTFEQVIDRLKVRRPVCWCGNSKNTAGRFSCLCSNCHDPRLTLRESKTASFS